MYKVYMDFKKSFGEKVKRVRKKRGLTQEQLAELIDISPRNLSKIEVGECFVKAETLEKILKALNISSEDLFATDHIKEANELLNLIYSILDKVKDDNRMLEKIYKMTKFLTDEN